jgi:hypothetical protein
MQFGKRCGARLAHVRLFHQSGLSPVKPVVAALRHLLTSALQTRKVGFAADTSHGFWLSGGDVSQADFRKRSIE